MSDTKPVSQGDLRFENHGSLFLIRPMDGHCISGGGLDELKDTLRTLRDEGETKAILILDAAYQFAVSIGVYAPTHETAEVRR